MKRILLLLLSAVFLLGFVYTDDGVGGFIPGEEVSAQNMNELGDAITATEAVADGAAALAVSIQTQLLTDPYTLDLADGTITNNFVNTANPWADNEVSDTLTSSLFVGTGSTTGAVDLATAEANGVLPIANGGTGEATLSAAQTALGVVVGSTVFDDGIADVQAFDLDLVDLADGELTGSKVGAGIPAANITGTLDPSTIPSTQHTDAEASNTIIAFQNSFTIPDPLGPNNNDALHWSNIYGMPAGFAAGELTDAEIGTDAVKTAEIEDAAVTGPKLGFSHFESATLEDPVVADNFGIFKAPHALTITDIHCITVGGTTAAIEIKEATATSLTGVTTVDASIVCGATGAEDSGGALLNAAIDAGNWVVLDVGAVTGSVTQVAVTVTYTVD